MINIAAWFSADSWTVLVFPRGKHRPGVYETKELTVSPATIDLCCVFVVPVPSDYEKIRGVDIEQILAEVTVPAELFQSVMNLEGRHETCRWADEGLSLSTSIGVGHLPMKRDAGMRRGVTT
jgi:hypothetical protein